MDRAEIDENGRGILFYGTGAIRRCAAVQGQKDVFLLETEAVLERRTQIPPHAGQFYLIRSHRSSVALDRPISVYHAEESPCGENGARKLVLQFLILRKGRGTEELCSLLPGDTIDLIGPLGNGFALPEHITAEPSPHPDICIVGGGIGVAPVAHFAASLPQGSYDFYACFRSGSYGLEHISPATLTLATDDGSQGIRGMLPDVLSTQKVREAGYKAIFACGPTPMLAYIKKIAEESGTACFLSMENHMLCGVGACLGCTIPTTKGNLRVCKDGPVFEGSILSFEPPAPRRKALPPGQQPDLSVTIAGVRFQNPVIAASGTFGFGQNYRGFFDVTAIGGICSKGVTLQPREGNPGQRVVETPAGNINSIGLQNPGIPHFIGHELPEMLRLSPAVSIVNLAGSDIASYAEGARLLDATDAPMIELNISCPNVSAGGMAWGTRPDIAAQVVTAVRAATSKPLMVKLSPNAPDLVAVAMACVEAGADALSLINTIQATAIDIESGKPVFKRIRAGLCGPAIKPIALRMVYDVSEAMQRLPPEKRIPIVGMGGIERWQDAVEFIMAGASAVQIGSAKFSNPAVMKEVIDGLARFMQSHGYADIEAMRGIAIGQPAAD